MIINFKQAFNIRHFLLPGISCLVQFWLSHSLWYCLKPFLPLDSAITSLYPTARPTHVAAFQSVVVPAVPNPTTALSCSHSSLLFPCWDGGNVSFLSDNPSTCTLSPIPSQLSKDLTLLIILYFSYYGVNLTFHLVFLINHQISIGLSFFHYENKEKKESRKEEEMRERETLSITFCSR